MKAVIINRYGGPEVLEYTDIPRPEPQADEVLIRVLKTSVNFADLKSRRGKKGKAEFPAILGLDLVGRVEQVGQHVRDVEVGQKVIAFPKHGSYAEYAIANEQLVYAIPDDMDLTCAAASPIVAFLSYKLLKDIGGIQPDHSVLIHSGSGGVGSTAIQLAKHFNAHTIFSTVGDLEKAHVPIVYGADEVYSYQDFSQQILNETNGKGVDLILDSVGGEVTSRSLECLAPYGRLVHFGQSSGEQANVSKDDVHSSCRSFLGYSLGTTRKLRPNQLQDISHKVIQLLHLGLINVHVGHEFLLEDVAEAHRLMEKRQHTGKIILTVHEEES
ncbi:quinone oxidoreductase family protein [Alkalicoccobacillus plakortidis]|uniref:Zinc-binding dehydrogenase n=1 Tax=Alkalicoccobacillus plakortidis TaxID=444060 RepID=A0ABT0XNS5_9BACI|nr:zinc-binding dehydrogenase [Alkalicoccobacillus plakortidis]MCM2677555.1 zinc-binding dehydrogenase [Alkalicoccobacillus plakortidis]